MTVKIVCVGTLKEAYWRDACAEYEKRLSAFCKCKIVALPESTLSLEKDSILKECEGFVVALCVEGKPMTSEDFAKKDCRRFSDLFQNNFRYRVVLRP
jgi:23S rRNA (pseudouridine1915-N3)-methyltransferase